MANTRRATKKTAEPKKTKQPFVMMEIDPNGPKVADEREPILKFGDEYVTVPKRLDAEMALAALRVLAVNGPLAAAGHLVDSALREDDLDVLNKAAPYMDKDQLRELLSELGDRYFGQLEDAAGN